MDRTSSSRKPYKFVQQKIRRGSSATPRTPDPEDTKQQGSTSLPLLFVHRNGTNIQQAQSSDEARAVTAHITEINRISRRKPSQVQVHPSVSRILAGDSDSSDTPKPAEPATPTFDDDLVFDLSSIELPRLVTLGNSLPDPFTSTETYLENDVKELLYLYFQTVRPFAKALHTEWKWFDSASEIQAEPMLCYAVAAYTSAFLSALHHGVKGIVLPPPNGGFQPETWPIPDWFRFQTKCLSYLSKAVAESTRSKASTVFQTVLFLLRLATLTGDGATAKMHIKALETIAETQEPDVRRLLRLESTVVKINLIAAFFHKPAMFMSDQEDQYGFISHREVRTDPELWIDVAERRRYQNILLGRLLLWHSDIPDVSFVHVIATRISDVDPTVSDLDERTLTMLSDCCQIALYLWTYLTSISFEPGLPKIRHRLIQLQIQFLELNLSVCWQYAPITTFNILIAGAFASRGFSERSWFVNRIADNNPVRVQHMHEFQALLSNFTDEGSVQMFLLEELLAEIGHAREGGADASSFQRGDLYVDQAGRTPSREWPFT